MNVNTKITQFDIQNPNFQTHLVFQTIQNKFKDLNETFKNMSVVFNEYKKYFYTFLTNQDFSLQKSNEFMRKHNTYTDKVDKFVYSYNSQYDNLTKLIEDYKKQPYANNIHIQTIKKMQLEYYENCESCTLEVAAFNGKEEVNGFVQKVKHFHYQNTFQNSLSKNMIEFIISIQKSIEQCKQQIEWRNNYQQRQDNYKSLQKQNIDYQDIINAFNAKQGAKGGKIIQIKNKYKNQQNIDSSVTTNEQQMSCQGTYKKKNNELQKLTQELFATLNNFAMYNQRKQISQPYLNQQHISINDSQFKEVQSQCIQSYSEVDRNDLQNNNSLKADENNKSDENKNISPNDENLFQNIQSKYTNNKQIFSSSDEYSPKSYSTNGFQEKLQEEIHGSQKTFWGKCF